MFKPKWVVEAWGVNLDGSYSLIEQHDRLQFWLHKSARKNQLFMSNLTMLLVQVNGETKPLIVYNLRHKNCDCFNNDHTFKKAENE